MASVEELLLNSLKDLETHELKEFQWYIKKTKRIPNSEMENADRIKTVDKIVDCFGEDEAVRITIEILKKMNKNNLAKELENKHRKAQAEGSTEDPELAGASSTGAITTPNKSTADLPRETSSSTNPPAITTPNKRTADLPRETSSSTNPPVTTTNTVPKTRNEFLKYYYRFTLDQNTVHKRLGLYERNRMASCTKAVQSFPDHQDRFDYFNQVMCGTSVSNPRCYWEIEWSGVGVYISVSYKSISRKGPEDECAFGHNDQSWSLYCSPSRYLFIHKNQYTDLPEKSISSKIGVYVDYSAGTLSFYSVSDTMNLIYTVQTTFTQPLYPGFYVEYKSSVKLC